MAVAEVRFATARSAPKHAAVQRTELVNSFTSANLVPLRRVMHRFCKYPQEIVLRLEQPSKIQQIQILSHEYKVRGLERGAAVFRVVIYTASLRVPVLALA